MNIFFMASCMDGKAGSMRVNNGVEIFFSIQYPSLGRTKPVNIL